MTARKMFYLSGARASWHCFENVNFKNAGARNVESGMYELNSTVEAFAFEVIDFESTPNKRALGRDSNSLESARRVI